MKLKCNLCKHGQETEELFLRTIKGRDFLVCVRHLEPKTRREIRNDSRNKECQIHKG